MSGPEPGGQLAEPNPIAGENAHTSLSGAAVFDVGGERIGYESVPSLGLCEFKEVDGLFTNGVHFLDQEDLDVFEGVGGEEEFEAFGPVHIDRRDLELNGKEHFWSIVWRQGGVGGMQRRGRREVRASKVGPVRSSSLVGTFSSSKIVQCLGRFGGYCGIGG